MAQLTLTRSALSLAAVLNNRGQHTWPLKVVCTVAAGGTMSPKIFVFHAVAPDRAGPHDVFEAVASVHQLADIPVGRPHYDPTDPSKCVPYYRLDEVTWHCLSPVEADELWANLREDMLDLVENQAALLQLVEVETYVS